MTEGSEDPERVAILERERLTAERGPGTIISAKYLLVRRLASGGMGDVYEAQHLVLGRRFALKFIRPELAGHEPLERRFRQEAETAGRLVSEHITVVTDFDWAGPGQPYLVMELLEGQDLAQVLKAGPLPAATVAEIGVQICRGLAVAHRHGFIHRDLKPANLFLCRRADATMQVKILDFGIAKDARGPSAVETRPGDPVGTAHYMAPEQIRQSPTLDARADLYSLGVVLYEALSGRRPRRGEGYHSVILQGLHERAPSLSQSGQEVPPALAAVVARAMAHAPDERFASAEELERALAPMAAPGASLAWPAQATMPPPLATEAGSGPSPAPAVARTQRRPGRRRWIATGVGAALVVGIAALLDRGAHRAVQVPSEAATSTSPPVTAPPPPPVPERPAAAAPLPAPDRPARGVDSTRSRRRRAPSRTEAPAARPTPPADGFDRRNPYR